MSSTEKFDTPRCSSMEIGNMAGPGAAIVSGDGPC
jgi:hypothetical protein